MIEYFLIGFLVGILSTAKILPGEKTFWGWISEAIKKLATSNETINKEEIV